MDIEMNGGRETKNNIMNIGINGVTKNNEYRD